jgi:putative acetyltransferase
MIRIEEESPLGADLGLLFARHVQAMHADTPPGSIHMLDRADLVSPAIRFFVMRDTGVPVGMGAFKTLSDPGHAEIKSMHVLSEVRGRGLARRLLVHLMDEARAMGVARLSLETGAQASFAPARALYAAAGFAECAPFEGYGPDPNSTFMTRAL